MKEDIYSFFLDAGPWRKDDLISQLNIISWTRFAENSINWDYYVEKYRAMFIVEHGFDPINSDLRQQKIVNDDFGVNCVCPVEPGYHCPNHPAG